MDSPTTPNLFSPQPIDKSSALEVWKPPAPTSPDPAALSRSAWISALARQVFGSYRKDDFADPDNFLAQLGMVLERYPDAVIRDVTSPLTGIQRRSKFPPTIAEVVAACDDEVARAERIRRFSEMRAALREPRPVDPTARANLLVHRDAPGYDAMVEWANKAGPQWYRTDPQGIWVPLGVYQEHRQSGQGAKEFRQFTASELRAIYRMAEADPCP